MTLLDLPNSPMGAEGGFSFTREKTGVQKHTLISQGDGMMDDWNCSPPHSSLLSPWHGPQEPALDFLWGWGGGEARAEG